MGVKGEGGGGGRRRVGGQVADRYFISRAGRSESESNIVMPTMLQQHSAQNICFQSKGREGSPKWSDFPPPLCEHPLGRA